MKKLFKRITKKYEPQIKKVEYFWEYYKWFVLIPLAVVLIILSFISTYIAESRPFSIGIALINTEDVARAVEDFEIDYRTEYALEDRVLVNIGLVHPKGMKMAALESDDVIASVQKYQTMVKNGYVDVTFTTDWVIEEYMQIPLYEDLRNCFDEEFLAENEEYIFYVIKEKIEAEAERKLIEADTGVVLEEENIDWETVGEKIPIGFKVGNYQSFGSFSMDSEPIMVFNIAGKNKEERIRFAEWIMNECKKEDAD